MSSSWNAFLVLGAALSAVAAALHFACIFWGAPGFRFLGAGEPIAQMAERGHWYPSFIAFVIGALLMVWAAYALSGAGLLVKLPFVRLVLSTITGIYLLRALAFSIVKASLPWKQRHILDGHVRNLFSHWAHSLGWPSSSMESIVRTNVALERDAPKAARPSTLRYAAQDFRSQHN